MSRALLQQALEALSFVAPGPTYSSTRLLMSMIKEELAKPDPEPTAWIQVTPSEWWDLAPWNYDMDSLYINERIFIKYADKYADNHIDIATMYSTGNMFLDNGHSVRREVIAWLPLPENK